MSFHLKTGLKETENKTIRFPLYLISRIESERNSRNIYFFFKLCDPSM